MPGSVVGVPCEIKNHEYRVGLTPEGVYALRAASQHVRLQAGAGARVGFSDADYRAAGAEIVPDARAAYSADLIVKVKEIQRDEVALLHRGQVLFCYHHFAAAPRLLQQMLDAGVSCVAYETVTAADGSLPLLAPMSAVAGRLAPQVGAWALQMSNGGSGVLLGGAPAVAPARVLILGAGIVAQNAACVASGMGADVTVVALDPAKAAAQFAAVAHTRIVASTAEALRELVADTDLLIGAVLIPGRLAPRLVTRAHLRSMRRGSVFVDVSIDQGGVAETSRPTSHTAPLYAEEGVVHYCVPNMPSAVARTATLALTRATLSYALKLATLGLSGALRADASLEPALQVHAGRVVHPGLASDMGFESTRAFA